MDDANRKPSPTTLLQLRRHARDVIHLRGPLLQGVLPLEINTPA
jgi:hypothetical protein